MNGLTAMQDLLSASFGDAKRLISRRLLIGLLLALATLPVAAFVASVNPRAVGWVAIPGLSILSFLYYADTMRLVFLPQYRASLLNVLRLLGVTFIWLGLVAIFWLSIAAAIAPLPVAPQTLYLLRQGTLYLLLLYFYTKLAFAGFALKDRRVFAACGRSWILTSGTSFWPTLFVMTLFCGVGIAVQSGIWSLHRGLAPAVYATFKIAIEYPYAILVWALIYPLLARWMVECEAHRGKALIVPPFNQRL